MDHLAVYNTKRFSQNYLQMMLDGDKTVDIKLSTKRIPPYDRLSAVDWIYLKESGGPVHGRVQVKEVENLDLDQLGEQYLLDLLLEVVDDIGLRDEDHAMRMWEDKRHCRYGCFFRLENPEKLDKPIRVEKYDRRTWISDYDVPVTLKYI